MTDIGVRACFCPPMADTSDPDQHELGCLHAEVIRMHATLDYQLAEAAANLRPMLWNPHPRHYRPTPLGDCYEASFGWVHVRPGCRCPRQTAARK